MSDSDASFEDATVAALLAQYARADRDDLLDELVRALSAIVPGAKVERTLVRRRLTAVRLPVGGHLYVLKRSAGGSFEGSRQQEVRGVVIRTIPLEIEAFLAELGVAIEVELRRTEQGRDALQRWLDSTKL
jgi:hypothetical protein